MAIWRWLGPCAQLGGIWMVGSLCTQPAGAQEPEGCKTVRFADLGWSDIAATTSVASVLLESLGYKPTVQIASVPITFVGLRSKQIDAFLGYWSPSMTPMIEPFRQAGQLKVLPRPNLSGAKYTLAVPQSLYDRGLKRFSDIAKFRTELDGKIVGLESGNDGNALVQRMIEKDEFGLRGFRLVESSEAGMLSEVQRASRSGKPIVFLGWDPHPMNLQYKMHYLDGGDTVFGPNYGEAKVYTVVPTDYEARCPNVAQLLSNLQFTTDIENQLMLANMKGGTPKQNAAAWLHDHAQALTAWMSGVKTSAGADGLSAVRAALKL